MRDDSTRDDSTQDEPLDRMLTASAPRVTELTAAHENELARMTVAARTDTAPAGRRGVARVAAASIAAALVIGAAGAAAAATGGFTSWWAEESEAVSVYQLPSGAMCEQRWGNITAGTKDEPIADAAREWFATADVDAIIAAGVDEEVASIRADQLMTTDVEGNTVPAPVDTRTDDSVYSSAVFQVVSDAMTAELERQGFDLAFEEGDWGLRLSGEGNCPGADW